MNRAENSFKKYLMRIMGTRWDAQSHEDKFSLGIPDLSYGLEQNNGWIELKQIKNWKGNKPVKPDKFTSIQVNWLNHRNKYGSNCFVMVKISNDYFLFDASEAKNIKTGLTKEEYKVRSMHHWEKSIDPYQLSSLLSSQVLV